MTLEDSLKVERKEWLAEGRAEGLAEGREEGRAEQIVEAIKKLVSSGILTTEKACEVLGVEISEYRKYVDQKLERKR